MFQLAISVFASMAMTEKANASSAGSGSSETVITFSTTEPTFVFALDSILSALSTSDGPWILLISSATDFVIGG